MSFSTFLEILGIDGEAVARGVENQMEIFSFSWGASNPAIVTTTEGLQPGELSLSTFSLMKRFDSASPRLFEACCAGSVLESATCTMFRTGDFTEPFLRYVFEEVLVESIQWSGSSGGDDVPMESVSLAFRRVAVHYVRSEERGRPGTEHRASWDVNTKSPG